MRTADPVHGSLRRVAGQYGVDRAWRLEPSHAVRARTRRVVKNRLLRLAPSVTHIGGGAACRVSRLQSKKRQGRATQGLRQCRQRRRMRLEGQTRATFRSKWGAGSVHQERLWPGMVGWVFWRAQEKARRRGAAPAHLFPFWKLKAGSDWCRESGWLPMLLGTS
eukprot:scaffold25772_cov136-Isochrysis_galbana.AAC.5